MSHEGDVVLARERYLSGQNRNLTFLLEQRFSWMNRFIDPGMSGIEVGAGIGASRDFIDCHEFLLTDYDDLDWLDVTNVDALDLPFDDQSLDFIVSSNMIHHVAYPVRFFDQAARVLRPGGKLLIQEIQTSVVMKAILRVMRHEGWDDNVDVFDPDLICTDPENLWSANCAIPRLLFDDPTRFESARPDFKIVFDQPSECLMFLNSGGVTAHTRSLRLSLKNLQRMAKLDSALVGLSPNFFALQRQIVLERLPR